MWAATLHREGRSAERHATETDATLRTSADRPVDILIADVSATGCLFVCNQPLEVGSVVSVGFAGLGRMAVQVVRREGTRYGGRFTNSLDEAAVVDALTRTRDGVVALPVGLPTPSAVEDEVPAGERWSAPVRLALVSVMAAASWGGVMLLRGLI